MVTRSLVVAALVTAASAATAHAQAPGEVVIEGPPPMAVAPTVPAPEVAVMQHRWALGFSIGSLGLAPQDSPDQQTNFGIGELSLRYRATLHLEVELAVGGGRQQLSDGSQGDLQAAAGAIGLRYRFCPTHRWSWWVMGAVGGIAVTSAEATDQEKKDAQRGMGELGVGLERRFEHFAIQAELRAIGVSAPQTDRGGSAPVATAMTATPAPTAPTMTSGAQSGGQATIGLSYYF